MSIVVNDGRDNATFEAFFSAAELCRLNPAARPLIDVRPVTACLRPLVAAVRTGVGLRSASGTSEDILQEFFVEAFEVGLGLFDASFSYRQYGTYILYRAGNRVCGTRRGAHRERPLTASSIEGMEESDPVLRAHQLQTYDEVVRAIEQLRGRLRQTAVRVWLDGLRVPEAAEADGLTINAVHLRLHRARHLVRTAWRVPKEAGPLAGRAVPRRLPRIG